VNELDLVEQRGLVSKFDLAGRAERDVVRLSFADALGRVFLSVAHTITSPTVRCTSHAS
jgi:hypothetical protein